MNTLSVLGMRHATSFKWIGMVAGSLALSCSGQPVSFPPGPSSHPSIFSQKDNWGLLQGVAARCLWWNQPTWSNCSSRRQGSMKQSFLQRQQLHYLSKCSAALLLHAEGSGVKLQALHFLEGWGCSCPTHGRSHHPSVLLTCRVILECDEATMVSAWKKIRVLASSRFS